MPHSESAGAVIGWDVGGAHLKACLIDGGVVVDVAQWPSPLWQGLHHLDMAIAQARTRWAHRFERRFEHGGWSSLRHAATMTGEMVDLFATRQDGVAQLAQRLADNLGASLMLYGVDRWIAPADAGSHWQAIASANWHATARWLATRDSAANGSILVDIGSTTTDLIALRDGRVNARGVNDAQRLASGELVYQGVVRTPLCALAPRVRFEGHDVNVMNEFFATTADVYRLTGELDPQHDPDPAADGGDKLAQATCQRLARMIGRDARDADSAQWLALARLWRTAQLADIEGQLARVIDAAGLRPEAPLIAAGCGGFLVAELAQRSGRPWRRFVQDVPFTQSERVAGAPIDDGLARWAQVCAPAVAVALLASTKA